MSKSFLIIDTPKACIDCPCHFADDVMIWCGKEKRELLSDDIQTFKPDWCPLKDIPKKKKYESLSDTNPTKAWGNGWNACLEEILNGEQ